SHWSSDVCASDPESTSSITHKIVKQSPASREPERSKPKNLQSNKLIDKINLHRQKTTSLSQKNTLEKPSSKAFLILNFSSQYKMLAFFLCIIYYNNCVLVLECDEC